MDGFKNKVKNSLQVRLALSLSLVLIVAALVAGFYSFSKAFKEANELQDDILRQVAALIKHQSEVGRIDAAGGILHDLDLDIEVIVQTLGATNTQNKKKLPLPLTMHLGLQTLKLKDDTYRVLLSEQNDGQRFVVAQETDLRDELAYDSAMRTIMPLLILIPVLIILVIILLRTMFAPIRRLSQQIHTRNDQDLSPIMSSSLPSEIQPFVQAINGLLGRVDLSMQQQRRFIADAAHELRTPMTALSLQAEHLANASMSHQANERVIHLRQGLERSRHLLEQLLGLARAQENRTALIATEQEKKMTSLSVHDVFRQVLEDLIPLAVAKNMDIGVNESRDVRLNIASFDLLSIVKNLVDNAIRYTPEGGKVDLQLSQEGAFAVIEVIDNGPGVAVSERERVLEPFYRVLGTEQIGSGLGLSIVQTLVKKAGGYMELKEPPSAVQGLCVLVKLPI